MQPCIHSFLAAPVRGMSQIKKNNTGSAGSIIAVILPIDGAHELHIFLHAIIDSPKSIFYKPPNLKEGGEGRVAIVFIIIRLSV